MFNPLCQKVVAGLSGFKSVADIGSQTLSNGKSAEAFYKQLGVERYVAYDIDGKHGAVTHDFNVEALQDGGAPFDLVVNNGTGEHIFNQANVFESCHNLCNREGVMVHILPWVGQMNHGFFNYQPVFFADLAKANGYTLEALYAGEREGNMVRLDIPGADPYHHPKPWKEPVTGVEKAVASFGARANIFIIAVLKQSGDKRFFFPPIQGKYQEAFNQFSGKPKTENLPTTVAVQPDHERSLISVKRALLKHDPFPHMIIHPALPWHYYHELQEQWPKPEEISRDQRDEAGIGNFLHQRSAKNVIGNPEIPQLWRQFFMDHTSGAWLNKLLEGFDENQILASFFSKMGESFSVSVKGTGEGQITLDCQFAINTPTKIKSFVRGPHIDSPDEIVAGLMYFPVNGDKQGGNLQLYRWKEGAKKEIYGKAEMHPDSVEVVAEVPYQANTAIFFLNGPDSIHGVTEREAGPIPRRYINLLIEGNKRFFSYPPHAEDQSRQTKFLRKKHQKI